MIPEEPSWYAAIEIHFTASDKDAAREIAEELMCQAWDHERAYNARMDFGEITDDGDD
jgi:hypothetical protein